MHESKTDQVKRTLSGSGIHRDWAARYLGPENDRFFSLAFDHISGVFGSGDSDAILDVGCGDASHAARLAIRGFQIDAVDMSLERVQSATQNVSAKGLQDRIRVSQQDCTAFTYDDETFSRVLCWGLLMHTPDLQTALSELSRIVAPGGTLIIGENNAHSLDSLYARMSRKLRGKNIQVDQVPSGLEWWFDTPHGLLLYRAMNISWLISELRERGFKIQERRARQFTECYTRLSNSSIRGAIQWFNNYWFTTIKHPGLALGNLLVFRKEI